MSTLVSIEGVSVVFSVRRGLFASTDVHAVRDLSLAIERGEHVAIVGESGSGKTTIGRAVLRLQPVRSGRIVIDGETITDLEGDALKRFRRRVGAVFQDPYASLSPYMRVRDIVAEGLVIHGTVPRDEHADRVHAALEMVRLRPGAEIADRYPHTMSGGQRQRVAIARAMVLEPDILVADEPVSMVDASLRATILESLMVLRRDFGISLLYITHDLTTAYQVSDDVIVFYRGTVAEAGDSELVVPQPAHPYTQLLIGSIPMPDTSIPWEGEDVFRGIERQSYEPEGANYCRFYNRCPYVMPECVAADPPLFRVGERRAASCFRHRGGLEVAAGDVRELLSAPAVAGD